MNLGDSMAKVTVVLRPYLMGFAGGRGEVSGMGETLGEVLKNLGDEYPSLGHHVLDLGHGVAPGVRVYVNNVMVDFPGGLSSPVEDGDRVKLLLVIGGG